MENQFVFKLLDIFHQERSFKTEKQESEYFDIPLDEDDARDEKKNVNVPLDDDNDYADKRVKKEIVKVPLDDENELILQEKNEGQVGIKHDNTKLTSIKSDHLQDMDSRETTLDSRETKEQFSCEVCFNQYANRKSLSHHRALHRGNTTCVECGKVYSTKNALRLHVRNIHLKEFKLACEECGYKTNMSDALTKHRRVHTGEKPFSCESCEYRCGDPNSIINHKRTHHDPIKRVLEQKHFCDQCGKSFGRLNSYKKHQDMHAGVKRAKTTAGKSCEICGKIVYGNAGTFAQHMASHTNITKCSICEEVFATLKHLSKHKNEQHLNLKKDNE